MHLRRSVKHGGGAGCWSEGLSEGESEVKVVGDGAAVDHPDGAAALEQDGEGGRKRGREGERERETLRHRERRDKETGEWLREGGDDTHLATTIPSCNPTIIIYIYIFFY